MVSFLRFRTATHQLVLTCQQLRKATGSPLDFDLCFHFGDGFMHQVLTDRSITTRDLASSFYALGFFFKNLSATEIYAQLENSEIGRI